MFVSTPAHAEESTKAKFLEAATRNIKDEAAKAPPRDEASKELITVCIPVPFADFDFYYTKGKLVWSPNPGQSGKRVIVPEGFCTDLASVPQLFWSLLPKTGRYAYAAIAHDFLYWTQTGKREEADDVLFTAMEDASVNSLTKWTIYWMVREFGQSAWDENTRAKQAGEKRFLKIYPPEGRLTSWGDWKRDAAHFSE
jgi:hypothetical protein